MLSHFGWTAATGALVGALPATAAEADKTQPSPPPRALNVLDFGAVGNGVKDNTGAFAAAMKAAAEGGNGVVFVPRGRYLIRGNLDVPDNVTLEGIFSAPSGWTKDSGSVLLAIAGAGDAKGTPFITLHTSCTLRGLTIFYPEQKMTNPPVPYPWAVRGQGDNISLIDVLLVNPYQGVDFGTFPAGRHYIRGLYGQPLYRGLFIDQCYDVGRIEDVHFWSFWGGWDGELYKFIRSEGIAFVLAQDGLGVSLQLLLHRLPDRLPIRRQPGGSGQLPAHAMWLGPRAEGGAGGEQPAARRDFLRERPVHGRY